jgi:hypothetical protein
MFESDKKSSLDRLKKGLYSRKDNLGEAPRHDLRKAAHEEVPSSWERKQAGASLPEAAGGPEGEALSSREARKVKKVYKTIFLVTGIFLVLALAVGAYTLFGGRNFVSVDNMDILVDGPVSVRGGEPLTLNVSVTNKNNAEVELVDLIATYPQGTKDTKDPTKDLGKVRVSIGNIPSQAVVQKTFESLMFGEEGSDREVVFTVEYRTANSNAIFYKEKSYKLKLASSPVVVSVEALDKVLSNQAAPVSVTVMSNTTSVIKDLLVILEYPSGYSVSSASPSASYSDNVWRIGDLTPGAKRTITVSGSVQGQDGETKTMHARVGIQSRANEREIATNIISGEHTFAIERPFLGIDLSLNGQVTGDVATEAGRVIRADIIWVNNSATRITNARIEVKLSGNALDRSSISASGGYYDSKIDTIIWDGGRVADLTSIAPGETNRVSFAFSSERSVPGRATLNPSVSVAVSAQGSRVDENGSAQALSTGISRSVKISSTLALSSRALRTQGAFRNTGPVPPKVDQETTYTVVWTVTNTSNSINDAEVKAVLPPYVSWSGAVSPADADLAYDQPSGLVTWRPGSIAQNADVGSGAKQVSFQVTFRPSVTQVGSTPVIIGQASLVGTDSFTGLGLKSSATGLSTLITTDPAWQNGQGTVVE